MLYYLDSVVIIYAVEGKITDQQRALAHLSDLGRAGHRFLTSELARTECFVPAFGPAAGQRLSHFYRFFHGPNLRTVTLTAAAHARAAAIRGSQYYPSANPKAQPKRFGLADALHLAAAIESGCDCFLTNDHRLANFPDIAVEVLPP